MTFDRAHVEKALDDLNTTPARALALMGVYAYGDDSQVTAAWVMDAVVAMVGGWLWRLWP